MPLLATHTRLPRPCRNCSIRSNRWALTELTTAARYPATNSGASERLLGLAGAAKHGFTIDTKVVCSGDGSGSLEPAAIDKSLEGSYERLQLHNATVNVLYAHMPDPKTPLEEQAAGLKCAV